MTTPRLLSLFTAFLIGGSVVLAETGRDGRAGGTDSGSRTGTGTDAGTGTDTSNANAPVSPDTRPVNPPTTPPPAPNTPPPSTQTSPPGIDPATGVSIQTTGDQTWAQIRNYTFEQRGEFNSSLTQLDAQMEQSITGLKARRATFTGDPNAWDSEMKRLDDARVYLKSTSADLAKATAVNWDDRKEKVSLAWERLQRAFERANGMLTP